MEETLMFVDDGFFQLIKRKLEKIKKGSNRMVEPCNLLIPNYVFSKHAKYLNVSVELNNRHAGMAEWLLQSADPGRPFGVEGSIPSAGVIYNSPEDFE